MLRSWSSSRAKNKLNPHASPERARQAKHSRASISTTRPGWTIHEILGLNSPGVQEPAVPLCSQPQTQESPDIRSVLGCNSPEGSPAILESGDIRSLLGCNSPPCHTESPWSECNGSPFCFHLVFISYDGHPGSKRLPSLSLSLFSNQNRQKKQVPQDHHRSEHVALVSCQVPEVGTEHMTLVTCAKGSVVMDLRSRVAKERSWRLLCPQVPAVPRVQH